MRILILRASAIALSVCSYSSYAESGPDLGSFNSFSSQEQQVNSSEIVQPIDFSSIFNADVVRISAHDNGAFDDWAALITNDYAKKEGNNGDGLPDDGLFPAKDFHPQVQLANFTLNADNAWKVAGTPSQKASITPANYREIHLFASAGGVGVGADANFQATIHFSDGSTTASKEFIVPDWYDDDTIAQYYDDGSVERYYLIDGMDRTTTSGRYENGNDPAIFGYRIALDGTKKVTDITFKITKNNAGSFVFFGGVGTTKAYDKVTYPPQLIGFEDEIIFTEGNATSIDVDNDFVVTNPDGTGFDGGEIKVTINGSDIHDDLSIMSTGSDTARNAISLMGNDIYIGSGGSAAFRAHIATIDNVNNGKNGKPLWIKMLSNDESSPLKNPSFENGLTDWKKFEARNDFLTEDDSSIIPGVTICPETSHDVPYNPSVGPGDPNYINKPGVGYHRQADFYPSGVNNPNPNFNQIPATEFTIDGSSLPHGEKLAYLDGDGWVTSGQTCAYGPKLESSTFSASMGARISMQWKAIAGRDGYLVKAELQDKSSGGSITPLFNEFSNSGSAWRTTEVMLPVNSTQLQFSLRGGSWDRTGGLGLGSTLLVDNIIVSFNTSETIQAIIKAVSYTNSQGEDGRYRDLTLFISDKEGETATQKVALHAQHAPVTQAANYNIVNGELLKVHLAASDIDEVHEVLGQDLITTIETPPSYGTFNQHTLIYTPTTDVGTTIGINDSFVYRVADASGKFSESTITINIYSDKDGDGVPDKDETAPDDEDPSKFPDKDKDGIADPKDPDHPDYPPGQNPFIIGTASYFKVIENQRNVATVKTVNALTAPQFSITGEEDAALFYINKASGVLEFIDKPDFDLPGDVGKDNHYKVAVQAFDAKANKTAIQKITIQVLPDPWEIEPGDSRSGDRNGELFLGGKYIELGISQWGDFGSTQTKPKGFYGTNARPTIGMSNDIDGFGIGEPLMMDYFLPGSPEERFSVGFKQGGKTESRSNSARRSSMQLSTTVQDNSDLAAKYLGAKIKSVWDDKLIIQQKVSFEEGDKFFRNEVTLSNISTQAMDSVRFMRSFDPDNTVDQGGQFVTDNLVEYTHADGDAKEVVKASTYRDDDPIYLKTGSRASVFFYSKDVNARASVFGFTNTNPYAVEAWDFPSNKGDIITADKAITLTYQTPTSLAAGESVVFVYYTSLDDRDFDDIEKDIRDDDDKKPTPEPEPIVVPPVLNIDGVPTDIATQNVSYIFTPVVSEPTDWTITFTAEKLPAWLAISSATGQLTGTPTNSDVGAHAGIKIIANGEHRSGTTSEDFIGPFTIVVNNVNDAPFFVGELYPSMSVDESDPTKSSSPTFVYVPELIDPDSPDWAKFTVENLPDWASFNITTGEVSGTPGFSDSGEYTNIKITGQDASGEVSLNTVVLSITVNNINGAPYIAGGPLAEVKQNESYLFNPTIGDDDGDALKLSIDNKPTWATFDSKSGSLFGTPSNDDIGITTDIVIKVSDDEFTVALLPFSIEVINVNDAPVISGKPEISVKQDEAYSFTPTASDVDAGTGLLFSIDNMPLWATFNELSGELSGKPTNADVGVTLGIVISVTDGDLTASLLPFDLEVINANDSPVISGKPETSVKQDETYRFTPTASDVDAGTELMFTIAKKPEWATFNVLTGVLTGTPSNDHVGVSVGIVIAVTDGKATTALPTFSIEVTNENDAPVISGTPEPSVNQDETYRFTPTASDVDAGTELMFTIAKKPEWATFNELTGALTGTPTNDDVGLTEGIIIAVTDGKLESSLPAFTIEVIDVELDPEAVDDSYTFESNNDGVYVLDVLTNDIHPENYEFELASASTTHGRVAIVGSSLELTLDDVVESVELQYYIKTSSLIDTKDTEQFKDNAFVQVTIDRSNDVNKPIIEVPADLNVLANALFTKVDLGTPTAMDVNGNVLPVSLVDGVTLFEPGVNTVYWRAVDQNGNEVLETQIIRVQPLVSLPKDVTIEAGQDSYTVAVYLNGDAPAYPVLIPFEVNGIAGEVTIISGTVGEIELVLTDADIEITEWEVLLGSVLNRGNKDSFILTVTDAAVPAEVSSQVEQAGEQRQIVALTGGEVTVTALVDNAMDGDYFNYMWSSDTINTDAAEDSALFTFDPVGLAKGVYELTLNVTKNSDLSLVTEHQVFIEVRSQLAALDPTKDSDGDLIPDSEEGYADSDNDGVPDYLDAIAECNVMQEQAAKLDSYLVEVEPGLCLRKGTTVADNYYGGLQLDIEQDNLVDDVLSPNIGGVFDFVITGLKQPGDFASIVIPQQNPVPASAQYTKYDVVTETWNEFVVGPDHGFLSSTQGELGYCPPPANPTTSNVWTQGLTEGHWCIQLTIKDGGTNDADGIINGTVVDPGGVSVVLNGNRLPVANDDAYTVYMDAQESFAVLNNDTDEDAGDMLVIGSVSTNIGTVSHDGLHILFTAPEGQTGQALIQYSVVDNQGAPASATAVVDIIEFREEVTASTGGSMSFGLLGLFGLAGLLRRQSRRQQAA